MQGQSTRLEDRRTVLGIIMGVIFPWGGWMKSATATTSTLVPLAGQPLTLRVGTYTNGDSRGVYQLTLNRSTGQLQQGGLVVETESPSFLAASRKDPDWFFAVGETAGQSGGSLTLFQSNEANVASVVQQKSSGGDHPCHVCLNQEEDLVAVANYSSGSFSIYSCSDRGMSSPGTYQNSGSGPNQQRQEGPHGHCVRFVPGNDRLLLAADLGTDQVLLFMVEEGVVHPELKKLGHVNIKPGAGPRQIDFHPEGRWFYVINELDSTICQVTMPDSSGAMEVLQTVSTLPDGFSGNSTTAHIQVHPNGQFLYGSNRGHDSIAMFRIDEKTGNLEPLGHQKTGGKTPRHFLIEPNGQFLLAANQDSDNVVVFPISPETGMLGKTQFQASVPRPVCLTPTPAS